MFPRSHEKKTVRLWCLEVPILMRSPEVRFGNTLSGGPPSLPRTHTRTHKSPPPYLTRTHTHTRPPPPYNIRSRQETELRKTYNNRNRQPASQPANQPDKRDQAVTSPQSARKEWMIITGGSSVITWYAFTTYLYFWCVFFPFFFFSFGDHFCGFFYQKYVRNFFFIYNFCSLQFFFSIFIYF
jgi:hypothetical protein